MKKLILIISAVAITISLSACSSNSSDTYTTLTSETSTNNEYSKLIVNSIDSISRQSTVVSDPTDYSNFTIPGNGVVESATNKKTTILSENTSMFNFDELNEDGEFHLNGVNTSAKLYKNAYADSQEATYLQNDTAVIKSFSLRNSIYPNSISTIYTPVNITGLYAPAGELVKIEISEELAKLNPKVYIGATSVSGETNDIDSNDTYTRLPNRVKVLTLSNTVNYVGSPMGGQIYIQAETDEYSVTISGAVEYMHYIHNNTTKEELSRLYNSTAPMIDIEIPDYLRINMPRNELTLYENEIYAELTEGLLLSDSEQVKYKEEAKNKVIDDIISTTDQLKAFVELSSHICPEDLYRSNYMTLLFDSYVIGTSDGIGKCFSTFSSTQGRNLFSDDYDMLSMLKVYNLHFWNNDYFIEQGSNEITTEILSILSYVLYATYGEYRTSQSTPINHAYSDAAASLNTLNNSIGTSFEIAKYTTLIHSFGAKTFIEAITSPTTEEKQYDRLYMQFSNTTQLNMEYYFKNVLEWSITDGCVQEIKDKNYQMYIPVASSAQMGQIVNQERIYTTQVLGYIDSKTFNINESIVVPTGMEYTILNVEQPKGTIKKENDIYYYTKGVEEIDEFVLTVKVYNSEYEATTQLIMGLAIQHTNVVITSSTYKVYSNPDNLSIDTVDLSTLYNGTTGLLTTPTTGWSASDSIFESYGEIYFPETKQYTINVRGIGDTRVLVGTNYEDLEEVVNYKQEDTVSSWDATDSSRTFTIDAVANQRVTVYFIISSERFSSGERIEIHIGYQNGSSFTVIPNDWWCGQYSSNKEPIDYYNSYNVESFYAKESTLSSTLAIEEELNVIYQTGVLDEKFLTTPNSDKQSIDPGTIFIYKYNKAVTANYFAVTSASASSGVLAFMEVHVSNNGVEWTEAYKGITPNEQNIAVKFNSGYTFKYVKLVFTSQYSGNYIDICNFELQLRCDNASIIDEPSNFSYTGNATVDNSLSNLNKNVINFDGKLKFEITGTALILFCNTSSNYGKMEVRINGELYIVDLNSSNTLYAQQVLTIGCLKYDTYDVEITVLSGQANIDFIAVE